MACEAGGSDVAGNFNRAARYSHWEAGFSTKLFSDRIWAPEVSPDDRERRRGAVTWLFGEEVCHHRFSFFVYDQIIDRAVSRAI